MLNRTGLILNVEKKGRSGWAPVIVENMEKVREKLSLEIKTSFGWRPFPGWGSCVHQVLGVGMRMHVLQTVSYSWPS